MTEQRLIDANFVKSAVKEVMAENGSEALFIMVAENICKMIDHAPTVDAVEVVHGRWKRAEVELDRGVTTHRFACSECGFLKNTLIGNYCPNCGAKMDGDLK